MPYFLTIKIFNEKTAGAQTIWQSYLATLSAKWNAAAKRKKFKAFISS
jgi:hypothetical protein